MDIAGYKLGREVDAGRFCTMYNALDAEHGKTVIVKVFNKELSTNKKFRTHFETISERLVDQSLGNNVHILDSIVKDDACVLVTNYCPCSTERQKANESFTEIEVLDTGRQLAASLSMLHDQEIVHGGVELSNIHFQENKEPVLGAVAFHRTMPGNDPVKFSVASVEDAVYLAPEAVSGLTASTDFFSLGVVLYKLLCGHNPYNTDSIKSLQEQKEQGKFIPLKQSLEYLQPLFKGLLAAKPEHRISRRNDYEMILGQCINTSGPKVRQQTEVKVDDNKEKSDPFGPTKSKSSSRVLLAIFSVAIIAASLVFFLLSGKKEEMQPVAVESVSSPDAMTDKPIAETPSLTSQQDKKEAEVNGFYVNAQALVEAGDYEAALQAINHAQEMGDDKEPVEQLKFKIETELKIKALMSMAEKQFANNQFILPPGDNAFETLQRISHLTSDDDDRADQGMQKIADHYLMLAKRQINDNKLDEVKKTISLGLMVKPGYQPLQELIVSLDRPADQVVEKLASTESTEKSVVKVSKEIVIPEKQVQTSSNKDKAGRIVRVKTQKDQEEKRLAAQKKAEQARRAKLRREAKRRQAEEKRIQRQREAEAAAQAEQQRLENLQLAQLESERIAREQREQKAREAEINRLVSSVESQLVTSRLSLFSLETAMGDYQSLKGMAGQDTRVSALYRKIVDAYASLAERQAQSKQLTDSTLTIDKGLALNSNHSKLLSLKDKVSAALAKKEKKKKAVPIIGTF